MSEVADAFLATLVGDIDEFNADLAASASRYRDGNDDAIAEQLFAVLKMIERLIKPPGTVWPLWDHFGQLVDRNSSRHGRGSDPVSLVETRRRAEALALFEVEFEVRGRKGEKATANAIAAVYPWFNAGQLIYLRKRASTGSDRVLQAARDHWLATWRAKYPDSPAEALQAMKKFARTAQKVDAGISR